MSASVNPDRDALMALLEEDDWGFWRKCPKCDTRWPNYAALLAHLRRDHGELFR